MPITGAVFGRGGLHMNKADEKIFRSHGKERLVLVHPGKSERKSIRNVLRENGMVDILDFESYDEVWEKLALTTTHYVVFPLQGEGGGFPSKTFRIDPVRQVGDTHVLRKPGPVRQAAR